jgi:hypothetical protein
MKTFHNKQKQKKFMTTKTALQKILKRILYREENATRKIHRRLNPTRKVD